MMSDQADIVLTYCANALQARDETPALSIVAIGKALNLGADYGLIALRNGPTAAEDLVKYILAAKAQAIFAAARLRPWRSCPMSSMLRILFAVLICLVPALVSARTITDSAGRNVEVPDKIAKVFAAGPPASILLYML